MSYIRPLYLKYTRPQVYLWNLKSSALNNQILRMLESLDLLSILATYQWNKQISLNFFFLSLHVIVEIYQIRTDNWIKSINPIKINKLRCITYYQNKKILRLTIIWFDFRFYSTILISDSSFITMSLLIFSQISIFFSLTST